MLDTYLHINITSCSISKLDEKYHTDLQMTSVNHYCKVVSLINTNNLMAALNTNEIMLILAHFLKHRNLNSYLII